MELFIKNYSRKLQTYRKACSVSVCSTLQHYYKNANHRADPLKQITLIIYLYFRNGCVVIMNVSE